MLTDSSVEGLLSIYKKVRSPTSRKGEYAQTDMHLNTSRHTNAVESAVS